VIIENAMEESLEKMDVSQASSPLRVISLPDAPISPWLRVALVTNSDGLHEQPLRVLFDYELVLQVEGSSWVWCHDDRGLVDVPPDSIAFIPPGFLHAWVAGPGTHIAAHFDLRAQPALQFPANMQYFNRAAQQEALHYIPRFALQAHASEHQLVIPLVTELPTSRPWRERLETLVHLTSRRAAGTLAGRLQAAEILCFALRSLAATADPEERGHGEADTRILNFIRELDSPGAASLADRTSIPQLAARAGMSEAAFRAAFVRTIGLGPRRYLEERRVEHAARALLETDRPIAEIARAVGYGDPYHFSRVFRRVTGVSPRRYRMQARPPQ